MVPRNTICFSFVGDPAVDSRIRKMATSLSKHFDVHIVALTSNSNETLDSIQIHPLEHDSSKSLRSQLFSFWKQGSAVAAELDANVYIASDLYSLPLAARAAQKANAKLIYDSRELYSAIAALHKRTLMQRFWNVIERRYTRDASAILTVNTEIANIIEKNYPDIPVRLIHNYPLLRDSSETGAAIDLHESLGIDPKARILISNGGLQAGRGLFFMIDLLPGLPECELLFLGDGPLKGELEIYAHGADVSDRVHFRHVESKDVLTWTSGAEIGLCFMENMGLSYYLSLPNKLFEYIHAGIPSILSDFPVMRRVVDSYSTGILIKEGSSEEAVNGIRSLLQDKDLYASYRKKAVIAARQCHWGNEEPNLLQVVSDCIDVESMS
jgi:glycosyltransferase involved in cell wall biosynthesis